MIRAVIIDDEHLARQGLKLLLSEVASDVEIVGMARSAKHGIEVINEVNPDLVFLDVQMPNGTGFDMLEEIGEPNFYTIFVTAFDEYAIQAFKVSAVDYILKPVDPADLVSAVEKVKKERNEVGNPIDETPQKPSNPQKEQLQNLLDNLNRRDARKTKVCLPTMNGFTFVEIGKIIRFESEGGYTRLYFSDGKSTLIPKGITDIEGGLDSSLFIRVHRSHIICLDYIQNLIKAKQPIIEMSDGYSINISRRKKAEVFEKLTHL